MKKGCRFNSQQALLLSFEEEDLISLNDDQNDHKTATRSLLLATYDFEHSKIPLTDTQKLTNFHSKIDVCAKTTFDIVNKKTSEIKSVPVYCHNRACEKIGCQKHRGSLFLKEHYIQQQSVNSSMKYPKAWVFTGWKIDITKYSPTEFKAFSREKFLKLYHILKNTKYGSITGFSIHMELKFNNDNTVYLHFHVVMGGIKCDIHKMRQLWGRVVKYEKALSPDNVAYYVSKYASKTPNFLNSEFNQEFYHLVVYKTQMHRFSISKIEAEKNPKIIKSSSSDYLHMVSLIAESKSAYWKDSYLNPKCENNHHFILLEKPKKPPDFVKPIFEKKPDEIQINVHENVTPDPNYKWESTEEPRKQKSNFKIEEMKLYFGDMKK